MRWTPNWQTLTNEILDTTPSLDPRLLVYTVLTKQLLIDIIKEYSSSDPANATAKFIINDSLQPQIQYRTKESQPCHPISGNNYTPMNIQHDCLMSSYNGDLYFNFMTIENIFKRKTHKIKFGINQVSDYTQSEKLIVLPPVRTVIVSAQGDTGANVSVTNDMLIIHDYFKYEALVPVAVFSGNANKDMVTLKAVGQVVMKIISNQGSVMN